MQRARWMQTLLCATVLLLLLGACAPQSTTPATGPEPMEPRDVAPKILTVGMLIEPATNRR